MNVAHGASRLAVDLYAVQTRDSDGFLWHPDLDQFARASDGGPVREEEDLFVRGDDLRNAGYDVRELQVDVSLDRFDHVSEAPVGAGWVLVACVEGEDGGTNAMWLRLSQGDRS